jgi:hypothetical protein
MASPFDIRLNNPGNLRAGRVPWHGQDGELNGFCRFVSSVWGLRALALQLRLYAVKNECPQTVRGIISRWAPKIENNTIAYVDDVCARVGLAEDAPIDVFDDAVCARLVAAIVHHEDGQEPYPADLIAEAVRRAAISHPAAATHPA